MAGDSENRDQGQQLAPIESANMGFPFDHSNLPLDSSPNELSHLPSPLSGHANRFISHPLNTFQIPRVSPLDQNISSLLFTNNSLWNLGNTATQHREPEMNRLLGNSSLTHGADLSRLVAEYGIRALNPQVPEQQNNSFTSKSNTDRGENADHGAAGASTSFSGILLRLSQKENATGDNQSHISKSITLDPDDDNISSEPDSESSKSDAVSSPNSNEPSEQLNGATDAVGAEDATNDKNQKKYQTWTPAELEMFIQGVAKHGRNFSKIVPFLPGRTRRCIRGRYMRTLTKIALAGGKSEFATDSEEIAAVLGYERKHGNARFSKKALLSTPMKAVSKRKNSSSDTDHTNPDSAKRMRTGGIDPTSITHAGTRVNSKSKLKPIDKRSGCLVASDGEEVLQDLQTEACPAPKKLNNVRVSTDDLHIHGIEPVNGDDAADLDNELFHGLKHRNSWGTSGNTGSNMKRLSTNRKLDFIPMAPSNPNQQLVLPNAMRPSAPSSAKIHPPKGSISLMTSATAAKAASATARLSSFQSHALPSNPAPVSKSQRNGSTPAARPSMTTMSATQTYAAASYSSAQESKGASASSAGKPHHIRPVISAELVHADTETRHKVQFVPSDSLDNDLLLQRGFNPKILIVLRGSRPISGVESYLNGKWESLLSSECKAVRIVAVDSSGDLYEVSGTVASVFQELGRPSLFRLMYKLEPSEQTEKVSSLRPLVKVNPVSYINVGENEPTGGSTTGPPSDNPSPSYQPLTYGNGYAAAHEAIDDKHGEQPHDIDWVPEDSNGLHNDVCEHADPEAYLQTRLEAAEETGTLLPFLGNSHVGSPFGYPDCGASNSSVPPLPSMDSLAGFEEALDGFPTSTRENQAAPPSHGGSHDIPSFGENTNFFAALLENSQV